MIDTDCCIYSQYESGGWTVGYKYILTRYTSK